MQQLRKESPCSIPPRGCLSDRGMRQYGYCPAEDVISLADIWRVLIQNWKLIDGSCCMAVLGAAVYLFTAAPVYDAEVVLAPPDAKDLVFLRVPGITEATKADIFMAPPETNDLVFSRVRGITEATKADIFGQFIANLNNWSLHKQFLAENKRFAVLGDSTPDIREYVEKKSTLVSVILQGNDPNLLADWIIGFISLAEKKTLDDFFAAIELEKAAERKNIQNMIQIERNITAQSRLDRIAFLEEQIAIARAAKITERQNSFYVRGYGAPSRPQFNFEQEPLYWRGVRELTCEKEILEKRKDDAPFSGSLKQHKALLLLDVSLRDFRAARGSAHAVKIVQQVRRSDRPVKPKRKAIFALSLLMGGLGGVSAVILVSFMRKHPADSCGQ